MELDPRAVHLFFSVLFIPSFIFLLISLFKKPKSPLFYCLRRNTELDFSLPFFFASLFAFPSFHFAY